MAPSRSYPAAGGGQYRSDRYSGCRAGSGRGAPTTVVTGEGDDASPGQYRYAELGMSSTSPGWQVGATYVRKGERLEWGGVGRRTVEDRQRLIVGTGLGGAARVLGC